MGKLWVWIGTAWLAVLAFAAVTGALRGLIFSQLLGSTPSNLIGSLLLCNAILFGQGAVIRRFEIGPKDFACVWIAGSWLVGTLVVEFSVGRLISHRGWEDLLAEYNPVAGRFWGLIVVLVLVAGPWVMAVLLGGGDPGNQSR